MRRLILLVNLLLMPVANANAADSAPLDLTDMSIEQLLTVDVVSASRLSQKSNQAPSSVSILTASDIRTFGWRTLAEALNSLRGMFTSNDRNYSYLGVRSFMIPGDYNSRVLLMIDGQRMNENIYDGGYIAQEFMLDMDMIERIEYMPGSGSSIYGANAYLGMINVVTKNGKAINGTQMAGEVGSFDTYKGRVSYGKTLENGAEVLFSASHFDSAGVKNLYFPEFDTPATNHGIAHNMDTERAERLFGKFKFAEFTLSGGYVDRFKRIPTAAYDAIFNDQEFFTVDKQFFSNLKYEKTLSPNSSLMMKAYYQGYDYYSNEAYMTDTRVINRDESYGRWWGGEAQLNSRVSDSHRLIMGLEYQYDQRQHIGNYDYLPYQLFQNSNRSGHRVEVYAQDDIQILDDLIFSVGLRLDQHHMLKTLQLNPRFGLIWNPLTSTTLKLLYSSTFRAPNVWERDYNAYGVIANPNNREERIKSYEAIVEWHSQHNLKLLGSVFHNDISQLLNLTNLTPTGDYAAYLNSGRYHVYGGELEAEQRWESGRLLKASYTYNLLSDETRHGDWAVASPQNLVKLHYAEPLFDGYAKLGVESIFIDRRKTLQGGMADGYDLVNLNLSSDKILKGSDVSLGVYNLFDSHYQMLGGYGAGDIVQDILRMNGREFRLKLQMTF